MKTACQYSQISNSLREHNIFFTTSGKDRHQPTDMITYDDNMVSIEPYTAFLVGNNLFSMGSFSYTWSAFPINTKIGRYCSIARNVTTLGTRHPIEWLSSSSFTYDKNFIIFKKFFDEQHIERKIYPNTQSGRNHGIIIGDDVWIGANVVLKSDICIGTGAVIAANSVVVKDVPPYAIVGGNPAKIIKYRFSDYQIIRLLASKWWEYDVASISSVDFRDIDRFLDNLEKTPFLKYFPKKLDKINPTLE